MAASEPPFFSNARPELGGIGRGGLCRCDMISQHIERARLIDLRKPEQSAFGVSDGAALQGWLVAQALLMDAGDLSRATRKADPCFQIGRAGAKVAPIAQLAKQGLLSNRAPAAQLARAGILFARLDGEVFCDLVVEEAANPSRLDIEAGHHRSVVDPAFHENRTRVGVPLGIQELDRVVAGLQRTPLAPSCEGGTLWVLLPTDPVGLAPLNSPRHFSEQRATLTGAELAEQRAGTRAT